MKYNTKNTIHKSEQLNIEIDRKGNVVSVWFNCRILPFTSTVVTKERADQMKEAYENGVPRLIAVELKK